MHTPTPWHTEPCQADHGESIVICAYGGGVIARIPKDKEGVFTKKTDADNAALIVKAVNSYEAMREALKGAQNDINFHGGKLSGGTIDAIKKALTLAEGKENP